MAWLLIRAIPYRSLLTAQVAAQAFSIRLKRADWQSLYVFERFNRLTQDAGTTTQSFLLNGVQRQRNRRQCACATDQVRQR